jgi:hypothetical protein
MTKPELARTAGRAECRFAGHVRQMTHPPPMACTFDSKPDSRHRHDVVQPQHQSPLITNDNSEVAAPAVLDDNILHAIGGMNENARIFNKFYDVLVASHQP